MDDITSYIIPGFAAVVVSLVTLAATLYGARKLGLTDLQKEVRAEEAKLNDTLRQRVTLLETENGELKTKVDELTAENITQARRIDALERKIADLVLPHPPPRRGPQQRGGA